VTVFPLTTYERPVIRNHFPVSRFSTSIVPAPWTTRKAQGPYRCGTTEGGRGSVLLHQIGAWPREDEGMMGSFGGKRGPGFVCFRWNQRGRENRIRRKPPAFNAETGEEGRARNLAQWSDTGQGIPWEKRADQRRRGDSLIIASGGGFLMGWPFLLSKDGPRMRGRREWRGGRGTHLC